MDNKIRINTSLVSKSKGLEILDQDVKTPDVPGPSGTAFIGKTALSATRFVSRVLHDVSLHVTLGSSLHLRSRDLLDHLERAATVLTWC